MSDMQHTVELPLQSLPSPPPRRHSASHQSSDSTLTHTHLPATATAAAAVHRQPHLLLSSRDGRPLFTMRLVEIASSPKLHALVLLLQVPLFLTLVLLPLLLYARRFHESAMSILILIVAWLQTKERGYINVTFIVLSFVLCCMQAIFSSLRLLLLLTAGSQELAPSEDIVAFGIFAVGAVAPVPINVSRLHRQQAAAVLAH